MSGEEFLLYLSNYNKLLPEKRLSNSWYDSIPDIIKEMNRKLVYFMQIYAIRCGCMIEYGGYPIFFYNGLCRSRNPEGEFVEQPVSNTDFGEPWLYPKFISANPFLYDGLLEPFGYTATNLGNNQFRVDSVYIPDFMEYEAAFHCDILQRHIPVPVSPDAEGVPEILKMIGYMWGRLYHDISHGEIRRIEFIYDGQLYRMCPLLTAGERIHMNHPYVYIEQCLKTVGAVSVKAVPIAGEADK